MLWLWRSQLESADTELAAVNVPEASTYLASIRGLLSLG